MEKQSNTRLVKIAFLSRKNPLDRKSYSGLLYYIYTELAQRYEVEWVYPDSIKLSSRIYNYCISLFQKVRHHKYYYAMTKRYALYASQSVKQKVDQFKPDLIFSVASAELLYHADFKQPVYYLTDAVFPQLVDYYDQYTGFSKKYIREGNDIEQHAILKCARFITDSEWTRNFVVDKYRKPFHQSSVVYFGFRFDLILTDKELDEMIRKRIHSLNTPVLLFVARVWKRKGGDEVVALFKKLRSQGLPVQLRIVGCKPENPEIFEPYNKDVHVYSFIDKNKPEGHDLLKEIYSTSHLFVLPTKADCVPGVLIESAQFGLPLMINDTGGVREAVREHENGFLFTDWKDLNAQTETIIKLFSNPVLYNSMARASRRIATQEFNWKNWGEQIQYNIEQDLKLVQ